MGTNLSFPIWIRLAETRAPDLAFTLRAIRSIDRWATIPAYAVVALTGLGLVWAEGIPLSTAWVAGAIALFVAVMAAGFLVYAPVSRRRLAAVERGGAADPEYPRARSQTALLDAFIIPAVLLIIALMVLRPGQ